MLMIPLMLALFMANLDQTIVVTALPSIAGDLRADTGDSSWIAVSYLLTSSVTALVLGKLGDMYGRKRIFQFSIVVFLVGSLLSGLAQSLTVLAFSRALQGIGGGGITSLVMAITGDLAPPRQRVRHQALLGAVAAVALVAGPVLGGAFADGLSWRWIFYVNVPIGIVALLAVAARLRLPLPERSGRVDLLGALTAAAFTTSVVLIATWGGHAHPWGSPLILALAAFALLCLACYLLVERRATTPITPLQLFRSTNFTLATAQFLLTGMVLFAGMLYVPMFLQTVQHRSASSAGLYLIPLLLGLVVAAVISGTLITRTGRYKLYPVVGTVLVGLSMTAVSQADQSTSPRSLMIPLATAGIGLGFLVQVCLIVGQNALDHENLGVATGVLNFFRSLGSIFGAALFGAILTGALGSSRPGPAQSVAAYQAVFFWTVPLMIVGLGLALATSEEPLRNEAELALAQRRGISSAQQH